MKIRTAQILTAAALTVGAAASASAQWTVATPAKAVDHRFIYSFHVGSAHPLGTLDSISDANIHAAVDLTYRLLRRTPSSWILFGQVVVGLNQFTAEIPTGIPHPRWTNVSIDLMAVGAGTGTRPYVRAGSGVYIPKSGPSKAGFNAGIGGLIPFTSYAALQFGIDYHLITTKPKTTFATLELGVLFH
jgi:hypothetical protein